ncbi:broad specificity phosphatase PhoE [Paenibacillus taihuensis]|uniref:Broad specificity phosphatase PhoE n=1 Tax=Paenibacillus taihuensis TaxID=1156355 RepID=A0A3D9SIT6_9BACL|nr:histidine phosphatase family protein [Paenibacillus taihuensis]REE88929.1 broad specificity phosphatase PhoE [Paenibacillus taihuensis]
MEFIFIRHGHGEHLTDYPNRLNTPHPSLTAYGKAQVAQLREQISIDSSDLVLVSPTKRTIETAQLLTQSSEFMISPLVGPRMFPQNPEFPFLACDYILTKNEITKHYPDIEMVDFGLNFGAEGINTIEQHVFETYASMLLEWIGSKYTRVFIVSHDGTITNYRMLLGEKELTRGDFLGEAGVYRLQLN